MRRGVALAMLLLTACSARRFGPCNDTLTCQAQQREHDREYARLVAEEPTAARLDVEVVSGVLHDRMRHLLYVTTPTLVALDVTTGAELWRRDEVRGRLARAGAWLTAWEQTREPRLNATVHFIDVRDPARPVRSCPLGLALHPRANALDLEVFDRAGVPHVVWTSWWSYRGGTPPSEEMETEGRAARGCGVVTVDPATCAVTPAALRPLMLDPPANECDAATRYAIPAIAASAAPTLSAEAQPAVRVLRRHDASKASTSVVLEVRDQAGAVKWTRSLGDEADEPSPP